MSDRLISVKDAKSQLGVGTNAIYDLLNNRELTRIKIGNRTLIAQSEISSFIAKKLTEAAA